MSEYPISPAALAALVSENAIFDTGFLEPDIIRARQVGNVLTLVSYRSPGRTFLRMEGSELALSVPLPGLLLICQADGERRMAASLWAVKGRPCEGDVALFHAPLPNVYPGGSVCFGDVILPALKGTSLKPTWDAILGTPFGSHLVSGKSRKHPEDIRQQLLALEGAKRYPLGDLLPASRTLAEVMP